MGVRRKVRALREGYDGARVRKRGEEFAFEGELGSWMEEIGPAQQVDAAPAARTVMLKPAYVRDPDAKPAGEAREDVQIDLDALDDAALRAHVERVTGEKVHHKLGRDKCLALLEEHR